MMLMYYKKMDMGFLWINYTSHRRGVVLSNTALHTAYITWQLFYFMSRGKRHVYALFLMSFVEIVTFESFKLYDVALKFMNFEYDNCCVTFQLHDTVWKTTVDTNLTSYIYFPFAATACLTIILVHAHKHTLFPLDRIPWCPGELGLILSVFKALISPHRLQPTHTDTCARAHTHTHTNSRLHGLESSIHVIGITSSLDAAFVQS